MNTRGILTQLSYGELSNLSMGNDGDGTIRQRDIGKVLNAINDGLSEMSGLFTIKDSVVHIRLVDHITTYHLDSRFAISQQPQPDVDEPYIIDNNREPFQNDVRKIHSIYDSLGNLIPINDENKSNSVFINGRDSITVPDPVSGIYLFLHYKAQHFRVTVDNLSAELLIPNSLVPALKMYVASRIYGAMSTVDASNKSVEYLNHYLNIVKDLKNEDATSESRFKINQFDNNGWV